MLIIEHKHQVQVSIISYINNIINKSNTADTVKGSKHNVQVYLQIEWVKHILKKEISCILKGNQMLGG